MDIAMKKMQIDIINVQFDSFKKEVDDIINTIISKIKGNNYNEEYNISNNLTQTINQIFSNYFNNNLVNEIEEKYNNQTLFQEMSKNYYDLIIPAFNKFNSTFLDEVYLSHIKEYVSRPNGNKIKRNNKEKKNYQ